MPTGSIKFGNAWRGVARIWDALFNKYLKDPSKQCHSWITEKNQQPLWDLVTLDSLPLYERAVHASTLDLAYIRRNNFPLFCADLRAFDIAFPVDYPSHLSAWASAIEKLDSEAIGFHGTSVAENPWLKFDEEKDQTIPVPLSQGWEIYDYLGASALENMSGTSPATGRL